jgi:hypothetical protein
MRVRLHHEVEDARVGSDHDVLGQALKVIANRRVRRVRVELALRMVEADDTLARVHDREVAERLGIAALDLGGRLVGRAGLKVPRVTMIRSTVRLP